jgi:hypothetical protein
LTCWRMSSSLSWRFCWARCWSVIGGISINGTALGEDFLMHRVANGSQCPRRSSAKLALWGQK